MGKWSEEKEQYKKLEAEADELTEKIKRSNYTAAILLAVAVVVIAGGIYLLL